MATTKKATTTRSKSSSSSRSKSSSARSTSSRSRSTTSKFAGPMALLHKDHQEVEKLFKQFEKGDERTKMQTGQQICHELAIHAELEESSFYPEIQALGGEFKDMVLEANEEHREVKTLVKELGGMKPSEETYEPKMKVLKEDVMHHVKEEETQVFPKLAKEWDKARMDEMTQVLERKKMQLMQSMPMPGESRTREEVKEPEAMRSRRG